MLWYNAIVLITSGVAKMNLLEFRDLNEYTRFDYLQSLAGDELKTFAREVTAQQQAPSVLKRALDNTTAPDSLIKNALKAELKKMGLNFKTPIETSQDDMLVDSHSTQSRTVTTFNWEKLKKAPFIEKKIADIDEDSKKKFLTEFYGGEVVDVDTANPLGNIAAVRTQVNAICDKMTGYGFTKFNDLLGKFEDSVFDIAGAEQRLRDFSNVKQIKGMMETILFIVCDREEAARRAFVSGYKDYEFLCSDGTLQNLADIIKEMQLGKSDINTYIPWVKRKMVADAISPLYKDNYFVEAGLTYSEGNERHDIDSLINSVADEFGLVVRTQEEDRYIKDTSAYQGFLLDELNNVFVRADSIPNLVNLVAGKIYENLKGLIDPKSSAPIRNIAYSFLSDLGLAGHGMYTHFHLVSEKKNVLREDAPKIIAHIVAVYLHEQGIVECTQLEQIKKYLAVAGASSANGMQQLITRRVLTEELEKDEAITKLIISGEVDLDERDFGTKSPVLYYARLDKSVFNRLKLRTTHLASLLEYATKEDLMNIELDATLLTRALTFVTTPAQVEALISRGADKKVVDKSGRNPAKFAQIAGRSDVVEAFRRHGVEPQNFFEDSDYKVEDKLVEFIKNYPLVLKYIHTAEDGSKIPNIIRIVKAGKSFVFYNVKHLNEFKEALSLSDSDKKVALHHAAVQADTGMFFDIARMPEGLKTLKKEDSQGNDPLYYLFRRAPLNLLQVTSLLREMKKNEVKLSVKSSLVSYETQNYDLLSILLKHQNSSRFVNELLKRALTDNDAQVLDLVMAKLAESPKIIFKLDVNVLADLNKKRNVKKLFLDNCKEEFEEAIDDTDNALAFLALADAVDAFAEVIDLCCPDGIDGDNLEEIIKALANPARMLLPISASIDEALSRLFANDVKLRNWARQLSVGEEGNDDLRFLRIKCFIAKGLVKVAEVIFNDPQSRLSLHSVDILGNNMLHCEAADDAGGLEYNDDLINNSCAFYSSLVTLAGNVNLHRALPALLSMPNKDGFTPLNLAVTEYKRLFELLLDWSVRVENRHSLWIPDAGGHTPFFNAVLEGFELAILRKFIMADAEFLNSIFYADGKNHTLMSVILDDGNRPKFKDAFNNIYELVKGNAELMRKFVESKGEDSELDSLSYARKHGMHEIEAEILAFQQNGSCGLEAPKPTLEVQATTSTSSTAWIPAVGNNNLMTSQIAIPELPPREVRNLEKWDDADLFDDLNDFDADNDDNNKSQPQENSPSSSQVQTQEGSHKRRADLDDDEDYDDKTDPRFADIESERRKRQNGGNRNFER